VVSYATVNAVITGTLIHMYSRPVGQFFRKIAPKFVTIYVIFIINMGCSRSHPLPPGIFVEMPSPPLTRSDPPPEWYANAETITTSNAFDEWTNKELDDEISRLQKRVKELETEKIKKRVECDDDDDIMHDPDVRKMVENGEHICHMFDGECLACEDDEEEEEDEEDYDDEVRVLNEEEVENDPEMTRSAAIRHAGQLRTHFC